MYERMYRVRWLGTRLHAMERVEEIPESHHRWWRSCDICGKDIREVSPQYRVQGYVGCYYIYWALCPDCMDKVNLVRDEFKSVLDYRKSEKHVRLSLRYLFRRVRSTQYPSSYPSYTASCKVCGALRKDDAHLTTHVFYDIYHNLVVMWTLCDKCKEVFDEMYSVLIAEQIRQEYQEQVQKFRQRIELGRSL